MREPCLSQRSDQPPASGRLILAGTAARDQFGRAAEAGFTPKIRFQTESYDVAQALVGTGYGVALVSRLTPLVDVFLQLLRDVAGDVGTA